jgi:MFS family permease
LTARFSSFRPLRHRAFALVWSAGLVSNIGTWMQTVAVGALVTQDTGQAGWTGLVAAAAFVPIGLLGPVGGALADRVDRRKFIMAMTLVDAALATLLAVLYAADLATPGLVSLVVFFSGAATGISFPSYQAMIPDLVGPEDLLGAVSLNAAQYNFGRVIGPAIAGVLISAAGYGAAFAVNAVSFSAVVVALVSVRIPSPRSGGDKSLFTRIADGVRVARADLGAKTALGLAMVVSLFASPFIALVPAMAILVLGGDAGTTSVLVTSQGIGAVTGALATTPLADRFGRRRMLIAWLFLVPVALVLYAAAPNVPMAAIALGLVGLTYIGVFSGLNVVLQLRAPPEYRGRVVSLYFGVVGIVYPLGAALQGWIGDHIGVRVVTAAAAIAMLVLVAAVALRRPDALAELGELQTGGVLADERSDGVRPLEPEQVAGLGDIDQPGLGQ